MDKKDLIFSRRDTTFFLSNVLQWLDLESNKEERTVLAEDTMKDFTLEEIEDPHTEDSENAFEKECFTLPTSG